MARVLFDGLVEYEDGMWLLLPTQVLLNSSFCSGTPATTSQMAKDVVTFLNWAAEPEHDERKRLGLKAVILFSTLTAISVIVKRFKWSVIKNRKISELNVMSWFSISNAFPLVYNPPASSKH